MATEPSSDDQKSALQQKQEEEAREKLLADIKNKKIEMEAGENTPSSEKTRRRNSDSETDETQTSEFKEASKTKYQIALSIILFLALLIGGGIYGKKIYEERRLAKIQAQINKRPTITLAINELSETWSEKTLKERFPGQRFKCAKSADTNGEDRICTLDIKSFNGLESSSIAFIFEEDQLHRTIVVIPPWAHGKGFDFLNNTLGTPGASQFVPWQGEELLGWSMPDGSAVFYNKNPLTHPLEWNAIYWSSPTLCAKIGCRRHRLPPWKETDLG